MNKTAASQTHSYQFIISGATCASCVGSIDRSAKATSSALSANMNLPNNISCAITSPSRSIILRV